MRVIIVFFIVFAVSVFAMFDLLFLDEEADLRPAIAWLERYYRDDPVGDGWLVMGVRAEPSVIVIHVAVPDDHVERLMATPLLNQHVAVGVVCPGPLEPVWTMIGGDQRIKVAGAMASGPSFILVDCRRD